MQYIYALSGKISLVCYIFTLQRLWHLCQYGGVRSRFGFRDSRMRWNAGFMAGGEEKMQKNGIREAE